MLDKGRLLEQGNHAELIALNGIYANLVRIQVGHGGDQEKENTTKVSL